MDLITVPLGEFLKILPLIVQHVRPNRDFYFRFERRDEHGLKYHMCRYSQQLLLNNFLIKWRPTVGCITFYNKITDNKTLSGAYDTHMPMIHIGNA